jgi:hypothetical protein
MAEDGFEEYIDLKEIHEAKPMTQGEYFESTGAKVEVGQEVYDVLTDTTTHITQEELDRPGYFVVRRNGKRGWIEASEFEKQFKKITGENE